MNTNTPERRVSDPRPLEVRLAAARRLARSRDEAERCVAKRLLQQIDRELLAREQAEATTQDAP